MEAMTEHSINKTFNSIISSILNKLETALKSSKIVDKIYFVEQVLIWMIISSVITIYMLKTNL